MNDRIIAVTAATGQQGGAVARKLLADGWKIRVLTRDVHKPAARALAQAGAQRFQHDLCLETRRYAFSFGHNLFLRKVHLNYARFCV